MAVQRPPRPSILVHDGGGGARHIPRSGSQCGKDDFDPNNPFDHLERALVERRTENTEGIHRKFLQRGSLEVRKRHKVWRAEEVSRAATLAGRSLSGARGG